jgi:hypothetical protein
VDKSIPIGIAALIISITAGAGVTIAVGVGMITQANAIYFLIAIGVLFLVGISFLVYGIWSKPKATPSIPTAGPQSGAIPKTAKSSTHKLIQAIICEIAGMGLMVGGALMAIRSADTLDTLSGGFGALVCVGIGGMMFIFGFFIFILGVTISQPGTKL